MVRGTEKALEFVTSQPPENKMAIFTTNTNSGISKSLQALDLLDKLGDLQVRMNSWKKQPQIKRNPFLEMSLPFKPVLVKDMNARVIAEVKHKSSIRCYLKMRITDFFTEL